MQKNTVYSPKHFVEHLVGLLLSIKSCCPHVNIYQSNLMSVIEKICQVLSTQNAECCQDIPSKHYVKYLVGKKETSKELHMYIFQTLSGLMTTLVPIYIRHSRYHTQITVKGLSSSYCTSIDVFRLFERLIVY